MLSSGDLVIPPGSLIVVTGANGFIASHVAHQAIAAAFALEAQSAISRMLLGCKNISRRSTEQTSLN